MAHGGSSPFQTSHDTLGMSYMDAPFMPSSPPKATSPYRQPGADQPFSFTPIASTGRSNRTWKSINRPSSASPCSSDAGDSEAHLSDYTFDLNKLPNAGGSLRNDGDNAAANKSLLQANDNMSEPGGPEDFTLNMVELLKGLHPGDEQGVHERTNKDNEDIDGPSTRAPHDEVSEIEPPSEMSTPIHILSRKEDLTNRTIQEDKTEFFPEERKEGENISPHQRKILDGALLAQQIRNLEVELQKERDRRQEESISKDDRIRGLENQLRARDERINAYQPDLRELERLQLEANQMRQQSKESKANGESTEIFSLRGRLEEKEKLLLEANARLDETMASHQRQLSEKAAEYSQLRSEQDRHKYALDQLDSDVESLVRERDVLQKRTQDLDKLVEHLETQVARLQDNLAMGRTEALSKAEALRKVAERMSLDVSGKSFNQILDLFEHAYRCKKPTNSESSATKADAEAEKTNKELADTRTQLQEATSLNRILSFDLDSTREELSEARKALSTIRERNSQLSSQLEKANRTRDEPPSTVTSLEQNTLKQLPNPVHTTQCQHGDIASIQKAHQQDIERIETTHATEISALRDTHAESARELHALLRAAQDRESELQAELIALRKTLAAKAKESSAQTAEQERLESIIEAKDAAAAALDAKFASVLKKREAVWESRIEKLLHERERMGKALLWTWGEKEVGEANKEALPKQIYAQGYRYKYAERVKSAK